MGSASIDDGSGMHPRFEYFVLRIARGQDAEAPLRGTIERLGTQLKREFAGSEELLELLGSSTDGPRPHRSG